MGDETEAMLKQSIDELKLALIKNQEQQKKTELAVTGLVARVEYLIKNHADCAAERKKNSDFRKEAQAYAKVSKPVWAILLLIIGGIVIPMIKPAVTTTSTQPNAVIAND